MSPFQSLAESLGEITAGPAGPRIGAFFDLDGTLVDGFTATAHAGDRIRLRQASIGEVMGVIEASVRYRIGRMTFKRLIVRAAGYLHGQPLTDLELVGQRLFRSRTASRVFPQMRQIVSEHQARGHTVVLSSSALTIHAEPVARYLGVDQVVCNHFDVDDQGRLTGDIVRPIIWGAEKAVAVQRFCRRNDVELQNSYFYADGEEDTALMRLVGRPRPVNPRRGLASTAAEMNWPVLRMTGERRIRRA